jgi:hypothetical protein
MTLKRFLLCSPPYPVVNVALSLFAASVVMILNASPGAAIDCPVPQPVTNGVAIKETPARIVQLSEALAQDETGEMTEGTVFELKGLYPRADSAEIINYMVTAYCPVVARNDSLSEAEKKDALDQYSVQVEALVAK